MGRDRVLADAATRGLEVELVSRQGTASSLSEAAELLGLTPSEVVKTLVVRRHDGTYVFVLVPGDRQISWPRLRAAVGVNKLRLPEAELAFEATGYHRGTITPLGSTTAWPVFADERLLGRRISLGAGEPGLAALVDGDALVTAFDAVVADLTDPLTH